MPGGCFLGPRPIDLHIKGFEALGATVNYCENGTYTIEAERLVGNKIYLDFASVGATINIMLAAVKANFTEAEIESWSKQEQGAKDIQAGNVETEAALFVAAIAQRRGIEVSLLVEKILNNVAVYGALSATVIGEQQRLDDLIKAAEAAQDAEALAAIVWTLDPSEEQQQEGGGE